ncbi:MAG: tyrosine recombinase [Gemmatimonadota bacterium]
MSASGSAASSAPADAGLPTPFAAALERFLSTLVQERGLSEHTASAYRRDLQRYVRLLAMAGVRRPDGVLPAHLEGAVAALTDAGLSPATVARSISSMRSFHGYLVAHGLSRRDPTGGLAAPRIDRRPPAVLTRAEVEGLMAVAQGSEPLARRDRAILELLYAAGLRVSELTALEEAHLLLDSALVRVCGAGARERLLPVGRQAVAALRDYRRLGRPSLAGPGSGGTFFLSSQGHPLSRMAVWKIIRAAARAAGLERPVSPHTLRHTFAAHLIDGGADLRDVQQLLGHADISTTQIYAHVDPGHLREVHRAFHPRG